MILWVADRFGMPGHYYRIWLRLITVTGMQPQEFRVAKLSDSIKRTLLTKLGSRKAPTWVPDEKPAIVNQINSWIADLRPRAIVLASPESLAYLDMAPEHATLHNLRGSVYERHGIPIIVSLPISAWTAMVTQKDIGAANYGFESQETFSAARSADREIHDGAEAGSQDADRFGHEAHGESGPDDVPFAERSTRGLPESAGKECDARRFDGSEGRGTNPARSPSAGGRIFGRTLPSAGTRFEFGKTIEGTATVGGTDERAVRDVQESDEEDGSADSDSEVLESSGDDGDPTDSPYSSGAHDRDAVDPADEEEDRFFYEPVLSPVGQFVLTNDMAKLSRILEQGRRSNGPLTPVLLRK